MKQGLYSAVFHDFVNFAKIGLKYIFAVTKCCILILKKCVFREAISFGLPDCGRRRENSIWDGERASEKQSVWRSVDLSLCRCVM